jgi:ABC-2 type transport system permease protein
VEFFKRSFQSAIAFRVNTLLSVIGSVLWIFVQVAVWRALLSGPVEGVGTTAREMVTYVILSALVGALTSNSLLSWIEGAILSGEIAGSLIKPMSLKLYLIAENLGWSLFAFVFRIVPILAFGIFLFGMQGPASAAHGALFLCSLVGGAVVSISLNYTVGLFAFWYLVTWHTHAILGNLMAFLSGSVVPLWFFPNALATIAAWLPFRSIYYVPISIYLGRLSIADSLLALGQQALWVLILYGLERLLWGRGIRQLVIQGG